MAAEDDVISAKVAEITQHRAVIEQAKGMLMLVYGLEAEPAFDLLRWRSQKSNVKLRRLAQELVEDFRSVRDQGITARSPFDQVLLGGLARAVRGGNDEAPQAAN
jgi:hypothetical protein